MTSPVLTEAIPLRVHERTVPLSGLFAGLEPGDLRAPLEDVLAHLCQQMSMLVDAAVVSVYVRERGDDGDLLVMRGNVGLAGEVVGNLRLLVGDGIVGWVAECMRPISVAAADQDPRFKPIRGIGEDLFPVMVAQPLIRRGRCLGVLVFQRAAVRAFADAELRMASVLGEAAALVLDAAGRREDAGEIGTEAVCLLGRTLSSGLGIGRVELIPTAEALAKSEGAPLGAAQLSEALVRVDRDVARLRETLRVSPGDELDKIVGRMELLLSDRRLRERLASPSAGGLASLTREYARAPLWRAKQTRRPDLVLLERAEEIGELCALLHVLATGGRLLQSGRVWIGRRLGAFFAMTASRSAAAVVLDGDGEATPDAIAIARAAGLPLVGDVRGLFAWTKPSDLLVVEGDRGLVRVNPSSSGVLAARSAGRERRPRKR